MQKVDLYHISINQINDSTRLDEQPICEGSFIRYETGWIEGLVTPSDAPLSGERSLIYGFYQDESFIDLSLEKMTSIKPSPIAFTGNYKLSNKKYTGQTFKIQTSNNYATFTQVLISTRQQSTGISYSIQITACQELPSKEKAAEIDYLETTINDYQTTVGYSEHYFNKLCQFKCQKPARTL